MIRKVSSLPRNRRFGSTFVASAARCGLIVGLVVAGVGCGADGETSRAPAVPPTDPVGGIVIPSGALPDPVGETISLPGGGEIHLVIVNGRKFLPIEGTFSETSYQAIVARAASEGLTKGERNLVLDGELAATLKAVGAVAPVLQAETNPEVGFFTALIPLEAYATLGATRGITRSVLINPVVSTPFDDNVSRKVASDQAAGLNAFDNPRVGSAAFSGLTRIGVPEFLQAVTAELGATPDGANVKVGVTDTGVTFNHPTFENGAGESRVVYMKDFTGEGRIYFHPTARFEITLPSTIPAGTDPAALLLLTAEFLVSPKGVTETPIADKLSTVDKLPIMVGPALRAILTTPGSGARLGVLSEGAYESGGSGIDINKNGKIDDKLWAILVPGANGAPDTVYVDVTTRGDFRKSTPLTNFNLAKATQKSFAEKFGLDIKKASLLDTSGAKVEAITATVVGFDPGNHGSHVAGIVAGRKTIANDPDGTLARGAAPAATIMVDRVCANSGGCRASDSLIDLAQNGAEVVNMSIGGLSPFNDGYGVQETILNRLTAQYNTLFFLSAGNSGPGRQTVGSPSVARFAISVGATASRSIIERQYQWPGSGKVSAPNPNDDDFMLFFSARGPNAAGGFKPDISAPGTELSSIQLNAAPGSREGLDVFWGTSMAAPTAAGAAALLVDAAKRYNARYPQTPLSLDAFTLRRVITGSARPFDVTTLDLQTNQTRSGQYTWIDQGQGMINLPRAWAALKAERDTRLPTAVTFTDGTTTKPVNLDYEVRVLRTNPNGGKYDATTSVVTAGEAREARYGRGIWLDHTASDSLVPVQIARRLPTNVATREDVGDLNRQLVTTADEFQISTVVHGSHVAWLKAGTLNQLDCAGSPASRLTVVGGGAIDQPINPTTGAGGSVSPRDSTLYVCVDRALLSTLPPGDHGAIITAHRVKGNAKEWAPSFVVPVYVTVPHKTLAGQSGYSIEGSVRSFGLARNYVAVPTGTNLVKVTIELPAPTVNGTVVTGCAGTDLMILEGGNTLKPAELNTSAKSRALSCDAFGVPNPATNRKVTYTRANPNPGIWDMHVFGMYAYTNSPYTLKVEYAKVTSSPSSIEGKASVLNGAITLDVLDSSFPVQLSAAKSRYTVSSFVQEVAATVAHGAKLNVPDADGVTARTYAADVGTVVIATGGSPGNDIDLKVRECDDQALATCKDAGSSGGATDVESVSFKPKAGKFYVAVVDGYSVTAGNGAFKLIETLRAATPETGTLTLTSLSPTGSKLDFAFDVAASTILKAARFTSGKYAVTGEITVADNDGTVIVRVPVKVTGP